MEQFISLINMLYSIRKDVTVQCQVVLVKPKTSDNWTSNRGDVYRKQLVDLDTVC